MAHKVASALRLDPEHTSCIGGRTVLTCRHCAGNAPRGSICSICSGRGFNIFICAHCNPAAAAAQVATPDSSTPNSPALSRSSSTSLTPNPRQDLRQNQPWRRYGDGNDGPGGGKVGTDANKPRGA